VYPKQTPPQAKRLVIRHERFAKGGYTELEVRIDPNGDLVLDGVDAGPGVKASTGDWDYEYWTTVPAASRADVLQHLASEYKVSVPPQWADEALLELMKRRFDCIIKFRAWCDERGIPATCTFY
jgi:hypothetical protein